MDLRKGKKMHSPTEKIALVTGANKGIGLEIARQLGKAGYRIVVGARDLQRGQCAVLVLQGEGIAARFVRIDLTDPSSAKSAAAEIGDCEGLLDVLVNNAGITQPGDGPPSAANIDAVRRIFDTNFFGTLAVTQAMLPLLRRSVAARIVNVSSGLASLALHSDPAWEFAPYKLIGYCASKAALNMMTVQLAAELERSGIKVNAADPGFTATDLNGHRGRQTVAEGAREAVRLALLPDDGATGGFSSTSGPEPW